MRKLFAIAAAAALVLPGPVSALSAAALPAPPQQMFEAMLLYTEQGDYDKAGRVLEKMSPLLEEIKAVYGLDLAAETRAVLKKGDAWEARTAVLRVVHYHMKLELAAALLQHGRAAVVNVRVAYLDYLLLAPRLERKDKKLAAEVERRFKSVYELVVSGRAGSMNEDEAFAHIREIERLCLIALKTG